MWRFLLAAPLALFMLISPLSASAASTDFFGPVVSAECICPGQAPGFGCIIELIQNVMNIMVSLSVLIAILAAAYAGFLLILNPTNSENRTKAKGILMNAVIGMIVLLSAWLIVDFILRMVYNPAAVFSGQAIGPWNDILLEGGEKCIEPVVGKKLYDGPPLGTAPSTNGSGSGSGSGSGPLGTAGRGACNATTIATAAAGAGVRMSSKEANTLACVAGPESSCGTKLLNYNWDAAKKPPPSTAYGPFQITLKGNSACFETPSCYQAAGVPGPLNCKDAFTSAGYSIPGTKLQQCQRAAANLTCSAVAAHCVSKNGTNFTPWTADKDSAKQQACINQNGG